MAKKEKLELNQSQGKKLFVACPECKRLTNHLVLVSADLNGSDNGWDSYEIFWSSINQIIQCQGCNSLSFRKANQNSEDHPIQIGPNEWVEDIYEQLFPNRNEGRTPIKDLHLLSEDIERIYIETLKAINGGQLVLSGIGIRALIETISKERNVVGNDLFNKINNLVVQGVLTKDGADTLHKLRVLGNKAAHEVKPHSTEQLNLAIDVIEHLLQGVYILPYHAMGKLK